MIKVGHKGADHVAPGNTAASFEAALECGVDMIEFDILPVPHPDGPLVLAHDYQDAAEREPLTLEAGLDHLAGPAYSDVRLDVDLKLPGYEAAVVSALTERGLDGRSLISSTHPDSLRLLGQLAPHIPRGWSVPNVRRDYTKNYALMLPAYLVLRWWRAGLPAKAARALRSGECEALMAHRLLVSPHLVREVQGAGGHLYVWTVDDADEIARLEAMGVDAVITNNPRLFDSL